MTKTWAKLQPRTQTLLNELVGHNVDNLDRLLSAWQKDKSYLLAVYQSWQPESLHDQIASIWPPL